MLQHILLKLDKYDGFKIIGSGIYYSFNFVLFPKKWTIIFSSYIVNIGTKN